VQVPEIKTQNILATGGIFLIALAMIIYGPNEQCIETEFFGTKIVKCDPIIQNPFPSSEERLVPLSNEDVLTLQGGVWEATKTRGYPGEFEFLENERYIITIFNEEGVVKDTEVGQYSFNEKERRLGFHHGSSYNEFFIYDIEPNSFKATSEDSNIVISFQRKL
jgi:hypothetical protein